MSRATGNVTFGHRLHKIVNAVDLEGAKCEVFVGCCENYGNDCFYLLENPEAWTVREFYVHEYEVHVHAGTEKINGIGYAASGVYQFIAVA